MSPLYSDNISENYLNDIPTLHLEIIVCRNVTCEKHYRCSSSFREAVLMQLKVMKVQCVWEDAGQGLGELLRWRCRQG